VIIPCKLPVLDKARLVSGEEDEVELLSLPTCNEDEMLSLVHVALQLRGDLIKQPKNTKSKLNDENCIASSRVCVHVSDCVAWRTGTN
jgi:hypothetical protein